MNYKIVYKRGKTIYNSLRNAKEPIPNNRKGIYEIPIVNDDNTIQYYIGSTARNISKRVNEHKADIRAGRLNTALAETFYKLI